MKTLTPIRSQPLPKLWTVFSANRRSASREALSILSSWKKIHVRARA